MQWFIKVKSSETIHGGKCPSTVGVRNVFSKHTQCSLESSTIRPTTHPWCSQLSECASARKYNWEAAKCKVISLHPSAAACLQHQPSYQINLMRHHVQGPLLRCVLMCTVSPCASGECVKIITQCDTLRMGPRDDCSQCGIRGCSCAKSSEDTSSAPPHWLTKVSQVLSFHK